MSSKVDEEYTPLPPQGGNGAGQSKIYAANTKDKEQLANESHSAYEYQSELDMGSVKELGGVKETCTIHPLFRRILDLKIGRDPKTFRGRNRKPTAAELSAWKKVKNDVTEEAVSMVELFYTFPKSSPDRDETWERKTQPVRILKDWYHTEEIARDFLEKRGVKPEVSQMDDEDENEPKPADFYRRIYEADPEGFNRVYGILNLTPEEMDKRAQQGESF